MTTISQIQRQLLNIIQQDFPLTERPYQTIADQLEINEEDVASGYIYILKSKSDNEEIRSINNLYKIYIISYGAI